MYALILVKEELEQDTDRLIAAQEIGKLTSKYLKVSHLKPLMVFCQNSDQEQLDQHDENLFAYSI